MTRRGLRRFRQVTCAGVLLVAGAFSAATAEGQEIRLVTGNDYAPYTDLDLPEGGMVNEIVKKENLAQDYNIYVFHGTDGDDWDTEGKESLPEIEKMLKYTNRLGVTIAENSYGSSGNTEVEKYLKSSGLLEKKNDKIRLDVMSETAEEPRIIEGIRKLMSE